MFNFYYQSSLIPYITFTQCSLLYKENSSNIHLTFTFGGSMFTKKCEKQLVNIAFSRWSECLVNVNVCLVNVVNRVFSRWSECLNVDVVKTYMSVSILEAKK